MRRVYVPFFILLLAAAAATPITAASDSAANFKDADIRDVLHALGALADVNVVVDPRVQGSVSVFLRDLDPVEAMELVVRAHGYSYHWVREETIVVGPGPSLAERFEPLRTVFFPLRYAAPEAVVAPLALVVQPAVVQADPAQRGVLVRGNEEQLALAAAFLAERDVPPRLELDFKDADLVTVFHDLALAGGYNLLLDTPLEGKLTMLLQGVDVDEAIRLVARQSGVSYRQEGNSLIVAMPQAVPRPEPVQAVLAPAGATAESAAAGDATAAEPMSLRVFSLHYIDPALARRIIGMAAPGQPLDIEVAGGSLLVRASESVLETVEGLLEQVDVPRVRVDGIVTRADQRLAVVSVGSRSYVVKAGDQVSGLVVAEITDSDVALRTVRGYTLRVPVGGANDA